MPTTDTKENVLQILSEVTDPEIPVLTIQELGILRDVLVTGEDVTVLITPTYSGCPAMDAISMDIRMKLLENGIKNFSVKQILSPAWTTEWITEAGKQKLAAYGIAPPKSSDDESPIHCPQCGSADTKLLSQFGSTSCKALHQCNDCKEPFDYFKCH